MATAKKQGSQTGYLHRRSDNFGKIPVELLHDKTITEGAKLLYCHMHWRYGSNCDNHEGRASMGDFLGVSEATITKRATELVAKDWIVALPRTDERGRTSNFYHVFEVQEDCVKWRTDHDKPKPEIVLENRKSRRGVGGRKTHKPKVSEETQVNAGGETQVNEPSKPELINPVNSSSHNPDSYDPETVIQTQEKTPADVPQTPAAPKPDPIPEVPILEEGIKTPAPVPADPSPVEPKVQPHVALIEAYHWSLPDDVRPPGEPSIKRNTRLASVLAKDGIKPYDVVRFVTCSYDTYRVWAENRGQSALMSFEHVHQYIKAYVTTKGLKHGLRSNSPAQANGGVKQHPGSGASTTGESRAGAIDVEAERAASERLAQRLADPEYQARMQELRRNGILRDRKAG